MACVLVADDDADFRQALGTVLEAAGYEVVEAATVVEASTRFARAHADVVIVDLNMPGNGLDLVRELRAATPTPVLVLSAVHDEARKIEALDAGADDYVTKPFSTGELLARLRTALRHRTARIESSVLSVGPLTVDPVTRTARTGDATVDLTETEFDLLRVLGEHAGEFVPTRTLLRAVWGPAYDHEANYVRVYVHRLRRKLAAAGLPATIDSAFGVGYRIT